MDTDDRADLKRIYKVGIESDSRDVIAGCLLELRDYEDALKEIRAVLTEHLADCTDDSQFDTPYGPVQLGWSRRHRSWNIDALLPRVLTQKILDTRTGELESDLEAVRAVWNLGAPRTSVLKARKIDPDEYCESLPATRTVTLPPRSVEQSARTFWESVLTEDDR